MGLPVYVLRHADGSDCTMNGASSKHNSFTLTSVDGVPVEGPFEPSKESPEIRIVEGAVRGRFHAVPVSIPANVWSMAGGNYITTSDSRFPFNYPVPIHDRVESS